MVEDLICSWTTRTPSTVAELATPEVKETFKQTNSKEKEFTHHAATQKTDNATDPTLAKASKPAAPKTQPEERTIDWAVLDSDKNARFRLEPPVSKRMRKRVKPS
jgi:hypothetical protein